MRLQHAVGEQAEGAEVGEARALAEAGEAGDVDPRTHPFELEVATDRHLAAGGLIPNRAATALDLLAHRRREERAQLRQQVEAGAVGDEVVLPAARPDGRLELEPHPLARGGRADVGDAAGDEATALVIGDRRQTGWVEDAAVGVLDEVTPGLLVE